MSWFFYAKAHRISRTEARVYLSTILYPHKTTNVETRRASSHHHTPCRPVGRSVNHSLRCALVDERFIDVVGCCLLLLKEPLSCAAAIASAKYRRIISVICSDESACFLVCLCLLNHVSAVISVFRGNSDVATSKRFLLLKRFWNSAAKKLRSANLCWQLFYAPIKAVMTSVRS